ncbi:hypothetical protein BS78_03G060500 [Paspalum vaginatum]|nr:hypothetical protein BS78_03G060500 [Paspalum vaginatum]
MRRNDYPTSSEPLTPPATSIMPTSSLNPDAPPFLGSAAGSGERVRLSASPMSLSDGNRSDDGYVLPSFLEAAQRKGKQVASRSPSPPRRHVGFMADARRTVAPPARGSMADARRAGMYQQPPPLLLRSVVVNAEADGPADDGWTTVVHRRGRATAQGAPSRPLHASRPVPLELEGRCFNCLSRDHVAAAWRAASRCFRCNEEGHQAKECWRVRRRRHRSPRAHQAAGAGSAAGAGPAPRTAPFSLGSCRPSAGGSSSLSSGSRDTRSTRSASTGDGGGRPVICATPSPPVEPTDVSSEDLVVIPHSAAMDAEEARLGLALVATIGGNRPSVRTDQVRQYLVEFYGVAVDRFSVHLYSPEDFLVIFSNLACRDRVLHGAIPLSPPFRLLWRPWLRLSRAAPDKMRFKVLLVLRGMPAHAWSLDSAQRVLGSSYAGLEAARKTIDRVNLRRFVVAAWCSHPHMIPSERQLWVPEPKMPHEPGNLFLREHEMMHTVLPGMKYLVSDAGVVR